MIFSNKFRVIALFAMVLTIAATTVPAKPQSDNSPDNIKGTVKVSAEEFIELVNSNPDVIVVDSRIPGDRKQGYLEGSVSLPDIDTNCQSLAKVIPKKTQAALFYCNGIKCGRSAKAVKIAIDCGYKNTYWFRGGFEEWLAKGYPYLHE